MFDFQGEFSEKYRDCFEDPSLLKQYLQQTEFIHCIEAMIYKSQIYYFKDNPDYNGEFLLRYRDYLVRALWRFEMQGISLSSFIGEMLKRYRLNFYKNINRKKIQREKIQNYIFEGMLEEEDWGYGSHIGETLEQGYQAGHFIEQLIECVHKDIIWRELNGYKVLASEQRIFFLLSVLLAGEFPENRRESLFGPLEIPLHRYRQIIKERDLILQGLLDKKTEKERLLNRCYNNYYTEQKKLYELNQMGVPTEDLLLHNKICKTRQRLATLRNQYESMKVVLTQKQISDLTGIPRKEVAKCCRYLKDTFPEHLLSGRIFS